MNPSEKRERKSMRAISNANRTSSNWGRWRSRLCRPWNKVLSVAINGSNDSHLHFYCPLPNWQVLPNSVFRYLAGLLYLLKEHSASAELMVLRGIWGPQMTVQGSQLSCPFKSSLLVRERKEERGTTLAAVAPQLLADSECTLLSSSLVSLAAASYCQSPPRSKALS